MYCEVDVEWLPSRPVDSILQAVVKASPPVHRSVAKYPRALEDPKRVAVNRKHVPPCTAPGFLDTRLRYAAWRSSYCSRASSGVRYDSFSRRQHWL